MLTNLFTLLTISSEGGLCDGLEPVLRLVGIVILGVKIVVPIILVVVGMFGLAKAVTEKDDKAIKEAQKGLVSKAIAGVCVFLVVTIVNVLMRIIGSNDYKACIECINHPFQCEVGSSELE